MYSKDRQIIIFIALLIVRVPLSRIIGDNGVGYLSGPIETYWCVLLLFGYGLTTTMRAMMKERIKREQYNNAAQIFSIGKRYTVISAVILMVLFIVSYDFVSSRLLLEAGQRLAFLAVGPSIFIGMFIQLNIGYLIATDNHRGVFLGEIIEAVLIIFLCVLGGKLGTSYGSKIANLLINQEVSAMYGAAGAMFGLCIAQFLALLVFMFMTLVYQRSFRHMMRSDNTRRNEYYSDVSGRMISGVVLDGVLALLIQVPILLMIVFLRSYGNANEVLDINDTVGAFYGKFLFVVGLFGAFAVLPIPQATKGIMVAINDSDEQLASERMARLFGRIMYFSIPAVIFITMLVPSIMKTLFVGRTTTVTTVLSIGASLIIIYALMHMFMSILLKFGYSKEMIFIAGIGIIIDIVLGLILIKKGNTQMKGVVYTLMISYGVITLMCLFVLMRNHRLKFRIVQQVLIPIVVAGIIGLLIKLLSGLILESVGGVLTLVICVIPAWLIYNLACMFLHVVSPGAMDKKFMGPLLVRLGQNTGIY